MTWTTDLFIFQLFLLKRKESNTVTVKQVYSVVNGNWSGDY